MKHKMVGPFSVGVKATYPRTPYRQHRRERPLILAGGQIVVGWLHARAAKYVDKATTDSFAAYSYQAADSSIVNGTPIEPLIDMNNGTVDSWVTYSIDRLTHRLRSVRRLSQRPIEPGRVDGLSGCVWVEQVVAPLFFFAKLTMPQAKPFGRRTRKQGQRGQKGDNNTVPHKTNLAQPETLAVR